MTELNIDKAWNHALKICMEIMDLSDAEKCNHIISLDVSQEVKSKALKIVNRLNEEDSLLDEDNKSLLINNLGEKQDLVGLKVDNYQLINCIAQGGMSSIYEAIVIDSEVQNHVAIKILAPHIFSDKSLELFKREQTILAKLKHPNIVSFHHSGKAYDGMQYLVMEYIENAQNILDYCINEKLPTPAIVNLVKEVAEVCTYAHNNLIIHRDIKKDNILIDGQGRIKVIDFGISQYNTVDRKDATQVFTPDSASPEQLLGQHVTVQSDVFSLGALLLHLLVKKPPLPKTEITQYDPRDDEKHINQILTHSDLDNDLKNIVHRAMHIDSTQRYATMANFAEDLENWTLNKPVIATADSLYYRMSKFYARNKLSAILVFSVLAVIVTSGILIYQTETSRKSEVTKKEQSLEIIRSVFKQANPLSQQLDESTLNSGFNHIKLQQNTLLDADPELKFLIYSEMAQLYKSNNFNQKAVENMRHAMQILNQIARPNDQKLINNEAEFINILHLGGQYREVIDRATKLNSQLSENNPDHISALVMTNLSLAQSHYLLNDTKQAKQYLEVVYDLFEFPNDEKLINDIVKADVLNLSAVMHRKEGQYKKASQIYDEIIGILRDNENAKKDLVINLTNLGVLKIDQDKYKEAEQVFLEAKQIIAAHDETHTQIAVVNIQYSNLLRLEKRYDEAETLLQESLPTLIQANDTRQLIWIYVGLTRFALHKNDIQSALKNFKAGYQLSNDLYGFDHPETLKLLNMLLGIIMLTPDQFNLDTLFKNIDDQFTQTVMASQAYEDYQILKALYQKQTVINPYQLSHITEILFDPELKSGTHKKTWLTNQVENSNTDDVLKIFSHLWLQEYAKNESVYIEQCSQLNHWGFTYIYPLKPLLIETCTEIGLQHGFEQVQSVKDTADSIKQQLLQTHDLRHELVENL